MAWTESDLAAVDAAILQLVQNKRVASTGLGGKDREFEPVTLRQLRELRAEIVAEIAAAAESAGTRRVSTTVKSDTW